MIDRTVKTAIIVGGVTLGICAAGFRVAVHELNAHLEKLPVPLRTPLKSIPKRLAGWESGSDRHVTAEVQEALGTDQYIDRTYQRGDSGYMNVHITYYTGLIDAVPHVPDRCLVASGWSKDGPPRNMALTIDRAAWREDPLHLNLRTGRHYDILTYRDPITGVARTVRMPIGDFELRTTSFRRPEMPDRTLFAGYFFLANGQCTPSPDAVRQFAFDLKTRYAYYTKIQFSMFLPAGSPEQAFVQDVSDLLGDLLPEVMRCLPDWSEIESRTNASPASQLSRK